VLKFLIYFIDAASVLCVSLETYHGVCWSQRSTRRYRTRWGVVRWHSLLPWRLNGLI